MRVVMKSVKLLLHQQNYTASLSESAYAILHFDLVLLIVLALGRKVMYGYSEVVCRWVRSHDTVINSEGSEPFLQH